MLSNIQYPNRLRHTTKMKDPSDALNDITCQVGMYKLSNWMLTCHIP